MLRECVFICFVVKNGRKNIGKVLVWLEEIVHSFCPLSRLIEGWNEYGRRRVSSPPIKLCIFCFFLWKFLSDYIVEHILHLETCSTNLLRNE